jgi:hypothetical protein
MHNYIVGVEIFFFKPLGLGHNCLADRTGHLGDRQLRRKQGLRSKETKKHRLKPTLTLDPPVSLEKALGFIRILRFDEYSAAGSITPSYS